ncbi:MAG: hypothetical protein WBB69_04100 [Anaerolineales bacterium]
MSIDSYIEQSKPAIQHLFNGLHEYDSIRLPSIMDYIVDTGLVRMTKEENKEFLGIYEEHFSREFSRASLAGSILQIAYIGIKKYSPNPNISEECIGFGVNPGTTAASFCLGRSIKGIPEGLLIFAGRIQYNHWEEGEPNRSVAKNVFRQLVRVYYDNQFFDMAYVLDYPSPRPVSHYIVRLELGWNTYEDYESSIRLMLNKRK